MQPRANGSQTDSSSSPEQIIARLKQITSELSAERRTALRRWCNAEFMDQSGPLSTATTMERGSIASHPTLPVHLTTPVEQPSLQETSAPPPEIEHAVQASRAGRLLDGRYELLEKTGSGAYSTVYRAKDTRLNTFVAVKLLRVELTSQPNLLADLGKLFSREAQTQASLTHPNIARVLDANVTEKGEPYIVTEFLEGQLLSHILGSKRPLP